MTQVNLSLSVDAVKRLTNQMKAFSIALNDRIKTRIEQATCAGIAEDVRAGIGSITDKDGNYLGSDPASVSVAVGFIGHDVLWRGEQIAYLEFGTGSKGAAGGYSGSAMAKAGYHPDPSKTSWGYYDSVLGPTVSYSLSPQAPMANAAAAMRHVSALTPARTVLKEALRDAFPV
jgi:hypothetical protein